MILQGTFFFKKIHGLESVKSRPSTVVFREIETAVPDERILVLFVPYILLAISYNTKVNLFGLNEVKIEIDSPGAGL